MCSVCQDRGGHFKVWRLCWQSQQNCSGAFARGSIAATSMAAKLCVYLKLFVLYENVRLGDYRFTAGVGDVPKLEVSALRPFRARRTPDPTGGREVTSRIQVGPRLAVSDPKLSEPYWFGQYRITRSELRNGSDPNGPNLYVSMCSSVWRIRYVSYLK